MALVMLPCDMPWWETLQMYIKKLQAAKNAEELITGMQSIHTMCNVGLDPDEPDGSDPEVLQGLKSFILEDLSELEKELFFSRTMPSIIKSALNLKANKPINGLRFSLQQEASTIEVRHDFACSLIAHAFLSTFPKRTHKTHPTLQDFNFCHFFRYLNEKFQKSKLRSIIHYFNLQHDYNHRDIDQIKFIRQIMKSKEWLTIEDWLECKSPLCPLTIKHDNHMENAEFVNSISVCFTSKKLGGRVLNDGTSAECVQFTTCPELLITLLCAEALEDNEVLIVENLQKVGKINNLRIKGDFEPFPRLNVCNVCCMDAENYTRLPLSQYEEDNVLREFNKALLAFKQKHEISLHHFQAHHPVSKRLSPIGESFSTTPTENFSVSKDQTNEGKEKVQLKRSVPKSRFIMLGSSGELLPISRHRLSSKYSSCESHDSTPEEFYSARASLHEYDGTSDEEDNVRRYSGQLDTVDHRMSFAERLREALCRAQSSSSTDSSYAVDISVTGSSIEDSDIRMKRGGSRGFILEEDSFEQFEKPENQNLEQCSQKCLNRSQAASNERNDLFQNKGDSSKYSFSTDCDSDLEQVYEQLTRWLDEPMENESSFMNTNTNIQQQKIRNNTIIQFAESLLKRTLSESFVGVPLTDGGDSDDNFNEHFSLDGNTAKKIKTAVRSLSLELAKHQNKLIAHSKSATVNKRDEYECEINASSRPTVITGNWGCGSRHLGDPQLKLLIQWLAASVANIPRLVYYTCNHRKLLKLDTVSRVLVDRRWNVGELVQAVIHYTQFTLSQINNAPNDEYDTLFDLLINSNEKCATIAKQRS